MFQKMLQVGSGGSSIVGVLQNITNFPRQNATGTLEFSGTKDKPYYVALSSNGTNGSKITGGTNLSSYREIASIPTSGNKGLGIWEIIPSSTGTCSYTCKSNDQYTYVIGFDIG